MHNSSLLSWVQLGLSGSLLLHARVLYCTVLIRSAEYQLPGGLETGLQPLLLLLIRCTLLMGFSDRWGDYVLSSHNVWPAVKSISAALCSDALCVLLCACLRAREHTLVYEIYVHTVSSALVRLIFHFWNAMLTFPKGSAAFPLNENFTSQTPKHSSHRNIKKTHEITFFSAFIFNVSALRRKYMAQKMCVYIFISIHGLEKRFELITVKGNCSKNPLTFYFNARVIIMNTDRSHYVVQLVHWLQ